jgi:predicted hotdog family 3-hydroxylacyl-ACP dehydratase
MLATKHTIQQYLPQRPPMVLIDDLLEASETHALTRLQVRFDNVFINKGHLSEPGMIENIAQTAAAQVGYQCISKKTPVPMGYIAAIKNLRIFRMPHQNSVITTSVRITNQVLDITVAEGKIELEGIVCCTCEIRIFVKSQQ